HYLGDKEGACCELVLGEVQPGMQFLLFSDGCGKLAETNCPPEAFETVKHFVAASAQTAYADNCTAVLVAIK
ncbi:MAG: hypothetical protein IJN82_00250, partial [Clostridia bacterium]|nr:hypothetical protein [Clostridia bacterium]